MEMFAKGRAELLGPSGACVSFMCMFANDMVEPLGHSASFVSFMKGLRNAWLSS